MTMQEIKKVAVLGSGIMGAGIAGFFADRGIDVSLFDVTLELSAGALEKLADPKAKIPPILSTRSIKKIRPFAIGAMETELAKADLVVEAVPEVLSIKTRTFADVDRFRKPGSVIASNTSGLAIEKMVEACSADMRENFLGMHFFNPVRYMPLVEVIPGSRTRESVVNAVTELLTKMGKRPILGRDTPNFVANRVGIFSLMWTLALAAKYGLRQEEIDLFTGDAIGRPKTGTFRLCDMVGVDTLVHAAMNSHANCPADEHRSYFQPPAYLTRMVAEKLLGDKTGKGFYQKIAGEKKGSRGKKDLLTLDLSTFEYVPYREIRSDNVRVAKTYSKPADRILAMLNYDAKDPVCQFTRELILRTAAYALNRVGEIAADVETIDNAIKWGFAHEVGPIEVLDVIGLDRSIRMMESLKIEPPKRLIEMAERGHVHAAQAAPRNANISLAHLKSAGRVVRENLNARLVDLGDGVLCCELDAKMVPAMNPVDDYVISMMMQAHEEVHSGRFRALVISNQAPNFCAGAQLQLVLELAKRKRFDDIRKMSRLFQTVNAMNLHASFPVVVAPHGMTLGGGLEIALGGQARVVTAELYAGLVEVGVGLVPAGGGCLFLLRQLIERMAKKNPGPMPPVLAAFDLIGHGKVSTSAFDAIEKGMILSSDPVVFSKDEQIKAAKDLAIARLASFRPVPPAQLVLPGPGGYRVILDQIASFEALGKIGPHGAKIARVQARILTGGPTAGPASPVSEETILELEREGFVELCAEAATQDRMAHMLKTGKPLLN